MKRFIILTATLICLILDTHAQTKPASIKFKAALMAYNKGKYEQALNDLKDAEKLYKKEDPAILYLKIMVQRALLPPVNDPAFYNNIGKFDDLELLRANCNRFLKKYTKPEYKYKQVQDVQLSLKPYPVAKVQFDEIMHLHDAPKLE